MTTTHYYAGIGSRETPPDVLALMENIGHELATINDPQWVLRSGYADGADMAFAKGADRVTQGTKMELFVPWPGFNNAPRNHPAIKHVPIPSEAALGLAVSFHPNWHACSPGARSLHIRNGYQIFGEQLNQPVSMVICWTRHAQRKGGTGQALRIAEHYGIPIFDLAAPSALDKLIHFVDSIKS